MNGGTWVPRIEYLQGTEGRVNLDGWALIHHGDGRTADQKLGVALAQLEDAVNADPSDARSVFYLAQTLRELGRWEEAVYWYLRRTEMAGWDEETYYAHYQLGCLLCEHVGIDSGAAALLDAYRLRPTRNEALRVLANVATHIADLTPRPRDALFVHHSLYVT